MTHEDQLREAYDTARSGLVQYRHVLLDISEGEVEPAPFHFKWSDDLLHGREHKAIQGFRESAKSQLVLRSFPQYCLTFPSKERDYIVIIKKNSTLARNKLKEIEQEYESNPAISANCVDVKEKSGDVFSVDVKDDKGEIINVRLESYGKGSSIRGLSNLDRRPKIVIIDDPQDIEDSQSETIQENDWNWFLSDVMFLGQKTRIFLIGNNLGEKCIIERVFANAKSLKFRTEKIPCMIDGVSSWAAKYTIADIEKERDDFRKVGKVDIWYREKMCEALAEENRTFRKEDFRYYNPAKVDELRAKCNCFIRTDLAISEKKTADYSVVMSLGIDQENNLYVFDCFYGRVDPDTFINELFKAVVRWEPFNAGLEKVAFQQVMEGLIFKEMKRRNQFFDIVELKADKAKELRIRMLQPRFKAHSVFFPETAGWLSEMEAELLTFPKGLNDDLADTLAYSIQHTHAPYKVSSVTVKNLPRMTQEEYVPI